MVGFPRESRISRAVIWLMLLFPIAIAVGRVMMRGRRISFNQSLYSNSRETLMIKRWINSGDHHLEI
jgi:hypothetical protein